MNLLPKSYYGSRNVLALSRDLLGKIIISDIEGVRTSGRIVETEAYRAPEDRGSHAFGNKKTSRTKTMFSCGGISYVYLCYGIHHLCNIVTGPKGAGHAILIRAIEPIVGIEAMMKRRKANKPFVSLTNGPGKWTSAMAIIRSNNGVNYWDENSPIRIYNSKSIYPKDILAAPRVGISYAQAWAHMPWRFTLIDNKWTSKPKIFQHDEKLI